MINFNNYVNENKTKHNKYWPYIPDHPYRILIIGGSGSGKTNLLLNLIENQTHIDKIYLYGKDPYESKYQYLINKREDVSVNHFNDPKAFIEYSNNMHDFYKNIDEYNPDKENKILIAFDDMIAYMIHNKTLNSIVTELFIRRRKLNISLVFITQSYFKVPKDVRLNTSHFFIAKIPNKRELQPIAINHSSDINTKDFSNIYRKFTNEPYSFLVIDTMLASNKPLRFRKNLFKIYNKIMTINNQIRDEKIQYDINREAAKISALSSAKIYKYEYLTGEDILPSNQQQIIEQTKFTYSPQGKAFEKQIIAIEDRGQKQVDALKVLEPKAIKSGSNNKPIIIQEIYDEISEERMDEIPKMRDKIDFNNLTYNFKGQTASINFGKFGGPIYIYGHMKNVDISLQQAGKQQQKF